MLMWGNERNKYEQKKRPPGSSGRSCRQTLFIVELIDELFNDLCIVVDTFRRLFLT